MNIKKFLLINLRILLLSIIQQDLILKDLKTKFYLRLMKTNNSTVVSNVKKANMFLKIVTTSIKNRQ